MVYPTPGFVVKSTFLEFENPVHEEPPKQQKGLQRTQSDSELSKMVKEPQIFGSDEMRQWWEGQCAPEQQNVHPWALELGAADSASVNAEVASTEAPSSESGGVEEPIPEPLDSTVIQLELLGHEGTREAVTNTLNSHGFSGTFDFIYVPMDLRTRLPLYGHALISFTSFELAEEAIQRFADRATSYKHCKGLQELVERYRNSPVMHDAVPDAYKPKQYQMGVAVSVPPPTQKVRIPRHRGRTNKARQAGEETAPVGANKATQKAALDVWYVDLLASQTNITA